MIGETAVSPITRWLSNPRNGETPHAAITTHAGMTSEVTERRY